MRYLRNFVRLCVIATIILLLLVVWAALAQAFDWRVVGALALGLAILVGRIGFQSLEGPPTAIQRREPMHTPLVASQATKTEPKSPSTPRRTTRVAIDDDGEIFEYIQTDEDTEYSDYAIGAGEPAKLRFIDHQLTVVIADREICGPVYLADLQRSRGDQYPAVIDGKLKVKWSGAREPLPYWPSYKNASPTQRGAYLHWLSEDRGSIEEVGYAFLYFYGLERYVLVDAQTDDPSQRSQRLQFIVSELERLQPLFIHSRSFQGYVDRLLEVIAIRFLPAALARLQKRLPQREAVALRYHLASCAESESTEVLDSDWVVQWLIQNGALPRSKSLMQHYGAFCAVFRQHYEQTAGIIVAKNRTKLRLSYEPASSGLRGLAVYAHTEGWCDPSVLKRPLKAVIDTLPEVHQVFKSLVRATTADSPFETLAHWPPGVPISVDTRCQAVMDGIQKYCQQNPSCSLRALSAIAGQRLGEKVSKADGRALRNAIANSGWVMVPNPDLTPVTLKPEQHLELYQGTPLNTLGTAATALALNVRLGVAIALADGEAQAEEVAYLTALVANHIDPDERAYLSKLLQWYLKTPITGAGLKAEISQLGKAGREELARRLIDVASADGVLPKSELQALEKTFDRLGLPKGLVARYLSQTASTAPVDRSVTTQTIPTKGSAANSRPPTLTRKPLAESLTTSPSLLPPDRGIVLDPTAIAATQAATRSIQSVLGDIFGDDQAAESAQATRAEASTTSSELGANTSAPVDTYNDHAAWHQHDLDDAHQDLLDHLLTKSSWSSAEIDAYCQPIGLLQDGALEAINEAAFEHLGDALIELDEPILIYHDLLPNRDANQP